MKTMRSALRLGLLVAWAILVGSAADAATPPVWVNYQGVLRDAADNPLDGTHDMVFRFYSGLDEEILIDRHTTAQGGAVTVSGGLFNAQLGAGSTADGSGPGNYGTLAEVFSDHGEVWLEVQIGADGAPGTEVLSPRTRVISAAYALNAGSVDGLDSTYFLDTSSDPQIKNGPLTLDAGAVAGSTGVTGVGELQGGYFSTTSGTGYAYLGHEDIGVRGYGGTAGGFFQDTAGTSFAYAGWSNLGIRAFGATAGGYFEDSDGSGYAYVGYEDIGVRGYGGTAGGFFQDTAGTSFAYAGWSNLGVRAFGATAGGFFEDTDHSGYAYVGYADSGIEAFGDWTGGYFEDTNNTAHAHVAVGNIGVDARGNQGGGYFADSESTGWAYIGYDTYKVWGVGSVAFVQNHPYEPDKVIAYNAPEGDEVATYTRGTARLVDGEARVSLGETFVWVTNPDLGLTAHVTPRSADAVVYVESVSTKELVVRNVTGFPDDAVFDYLVYGLRIGFEEKSVVQPKQLESYIPSMAGDRTLYEQAPDLRSYNAFERFKGMREVVFRDDAGTLDLSASHALRDAIHEYDPASDPPLGNLAGHGTGRRKERPVGPEATEPEAPVMPEIEPRGESPATVAGIPAMRGDEPGTETDLSPAYPTFPVSEPVEPGDLLVLDPMNPGRVRPADVTADPSVVGIAAAESTLVENRLEVQLVDSLYAVVKADAGYGEIRAGDLLTSSFTPGHAMRAGEIVPGTIIGKALGPLETGTGLIKVLVMPR